MTDDHPPFEPDELDELLSAELDGELDAAARDLGLTRDEAAARLRETPGVDERRRALASARDQLTTLPELDELLEARLRAKAVRVADDRFSAHIAARRERRRHVLEAVGGIAAAAVLVVAVSAALRHDSASSSKAASNPRALQRDAAAATHGQRARAAAKNDLGTFADARAVGVAAVARSEQAQKANGATTRGPSGQLSTSRPSQNGAVTSTVAPKAVAPKAGPANDTPSTPLDTSAEAKNASRFDLAQADTVTRAVDRCGLPPNVSVAGTLTLRASAVLGGRPVVVLVFAGKAEDTVVIENPDCTLKNIQELG
jgi:hypothetical protein